MDKKLADRLLDAADGTKTGAILRCALNRTGTELPRFVGKALITSDGFLLCNFYDADTNYHAGAFVGSYADLQDNLFGMYGLAVQLKLTKDEEAELQALVKNWITIDYRS